MFNVIEMKRWWVGFCFHYRPLHKPFCWVSERGLSGMEMISTMSKRLENSFLPPAEKLRGENVFFTGRSHDWGDAIPEENN